MTQTAIPEITDEQLAILREKVSLCNPLVQSLVRRLDRVEQEREFLRDNADILDYNALEYLKTIDRVQEENTALRERVKELTQCDPAWYDASPADAFMLLKKAQERGKRMEAALRIYGKHRPSCATGYSHLISNCDCGLTAALKEGSNERTMRHAGQRD